MFCFTRASAVAAASLMTASLLALGAAPALAAPPEGPIVVQGIGPDMSPDAAAPGPQFGRYGGGFIEFLMTGRSAPARSMPAHGPAMALATAPQGAPYRGMYQGTAYQGAAYQNGSYQGGEPQADYYEPAPGTPPGQPVPGYLAPRKAVDPMFVRQEVPYAGPQAPGTVVIDTANKFLYLVGSGGHALRYGIGVGRPGFLWHGEEQITRKAEWPDWTPPSEMIKRRPDLPSHMDGGLSNPLGARAMYLGSSLYRIHGTNEPDTIGTNVSSGCIRLTNDDVSDLFSRVHVGTHVIVL